MINLLAQRQQSPYGNGTEALQTNFTLSESHALNPLLSLNLGGSYISSSYQFVTPGSLDKAISGNAGFTYHATEHLDFNVNYQYRYETLTEETEAADDNAVTMGLIYHPQVWTMLQ